MKIRTKLAAITLASLIGSINNIDASAYEVYDQEIQTEGDNVNKVPYVVANSDSVVIKSSNSNKIIGKLNQGDMLTLNCLLDNGYYEVNYNNGIGYVDKNNASVVYKYQFDHMVTFINDCTLTQSNGNKILVEKQNVGKLYKNIGSWSLVEVDEVIGYVKTNNLDLLDNTFVLIDLSDQELKLYNDNQIILDCPIISGKDKTPTNCGDFKVYEKRYNTILRDEKKTYASPVDVFMKFDGGIGLHDAYRWRNNSEYEIKDYYRRNGSHGCVNMRKEDALFVSDYVEVGTRVLVKK